MPTAEQNSYQPGVYREQGGNILRFKRTALMGVPECLLWGNAPVLQCLADISYGYLFQDDLLHPATSAVSDVLAWTAANDGGTGTPVFQDTAGGVFNVVTAASDNDYAAYHHPYEMFNLAAGKKLWFEARFKLAYGASTEAAFWMGLTDTLTTGGFQADAAGPLADYDGALIWKDEDGTTLNFETSNATSQNTTSGMATFISDTWTRVGFYFDGTATTSIITPYYEVTGVAGAAMIAGTAQNLTLASMTASELVFGVKSKGTAETLQMDYIRVLQLR
jgi:hypothetical protein